MDTNAIGAAALLAVFLMPVVSLIKKPSWSHEAKYLLGMVAALLAAVGGAVMDGDVHTAKEFLPYFGTAFGTAQTLYNLYFGKTDMNDQLTEFGG